MMHTFILISCLLFFVMGALPAFGAETETKKLTKEVRVYGGNFSGQVAESIRRMKEELGKDGCIDFSRSYWTSGDSTLVHIEVQCTEYLWEKKRNKHSSVGF